MESNGARSVTLSSKLSGRTVASGRQNTGWWDHPRIEIEGGIFWIQIPKDRVKWEVIAIRVWAKEAEMILRTRRRFWAARKW